MQNYTWYRPVRILFGPGQLENLGPAVTGIGENCLLMIGGGSVVRNGYLARVIQQLDAHKVRWVLFEGVEPNPSAKTVDRAAAAREAEACDFVLALGGGSVMDAAKLVACLGRNPGRCWDYMRRDAEQKPFTDALPLVCVSTFAATGSEANGNAVITNTDTDEKLAIKHEALVPALSVVDPELTLTLPAEATAAGGLDIVCHAMEAYWSQKNFDTPLQDRLSESIFRTVVEALPNALRDGHDVGARNDLALASSYAMMGLAMGQDGSAPLHMMEHPLSGVFNVTHGLGLAALLPETLRYNCGQDCRMAARMGRNVFDVREPDDAKAARQGIEALEAWMKQTGLRVKLSHIGVTADRLEKAAQLAVQIFPGAVIPNIRPLRKSDVLNIYRACL
ncbi:MAG: iron-containing alcohol dehydrogenase [Kiritimatiellae bacterium]|nr:iron-containing alcohol dehydrogenase [Kiritimatiellia bacterium]